MNKEIFLKKAEDSFDKTVYEPEGLFFYHFFDFQFDYDDILRTCKVTCSVKEPMWNSFQMVHGGFLSYIADTALGHLNLHFYEGTFVTLEMKTSFLKGIKTGEITAISRFVKEGRKVLFSECEIFNGNNEKLCITSGTFYRKDQR
ncbi:PaaI family thioesterase [Neobacillus novalis]|uniref:PaaI family thioesterase n=1 Tax=Neobacillus novalis TaxID=220687 RepID=A0AA95MI46_9BACI|nr:PaaI family thioesterase [Neobacillus novalis]WHY84005.1 PaaI family thioesterase [Neobacillus novalis]